MRSTGRRWAPAATALAVLTLWSGTLAGAAETGLDSLMQRLAQHPHGHATFTERQYMALLDRPLESSGELFYEAPDRLEKRTLQPKAESLLLERGTLTMRRGARTRTFALRDYPQFAPLIDSIRATLAGDIAALQRSYNVSYEESGGGWRLELVPRDPKLAALIARIRILGSADLVRTVETWRTDGDHSVMSISPVADG